MYQSVDLEIFFTEKNCVLFCDWYLGLQFFTEKDVSFFYQHKFIFQIFEFHFFSKKQKLVIFIFKLFEKHSVWGCF